MTLFRELTNKDFSEGLSLGMKMFNESPHYSKFTFDLDQALEMSNMLSDPGVFAYGAIRNGKLVGMFLGSLGKQPFCKEIVGHDILLFVDPAERGGAMAVVLINKFKKWAMEQGAFSINLGVSVVNPMAEELYEKLGCARIGGIYTMYL